MSWNSSSPCKFLVVVVLVLLRKSSTTISSPNNGSSVLGPVGHFGVQRTVTLNSAMISSMRGVKLNNSTPPFGTNRLYFSLHRYVAELYAATYIVSNGIQSANSSSKSVIRNIVVTVCSSS